MSRLGKKPVQIPEGVVVRIEDDSIFIKGPKGELTQKIHPSVLIQQKDNCLLFKVKNPKEKKQKALWGLFQRLVSNMVIGVTQGNEKRLELIGVGYRAQVEGQKLILSVGFSHPVEFILPDQIEVKIEKNVIIISGVNKKLVGETAAQIRKIRKPEPYKGTGIRYFGEVIRKKAGKKAVSASI